MKLIITLIFFGVTVVANATDHYASSANEANKLCAEAKAGDRVIMKNGVYKDAVIEFENNNGTEAMPVTFCAETDGNALFEGNSRISFSGKYVVVNGFVWKNGGKDMKTKSPIEIKGSHCTFSNCVIDDFNNRIDTIDNKWVSVYGEYNTVTRCLLKDKKNLGATLVVWLKNGEPAHHTISHNYFLNRINGPNADNGLESMRIGDSKTSMTDAHCVVAFNRFENCDGEIEIISNKSCHNSYFNNTFYNNDGGLTLRHGNNCWVNGNVFDGGEKQKSYGVRIIGEGHLVTNNYFYHLKGATRKGSEDKFRAPVTMVNGLENTPQNGYFQVRRAVVADNVFVNNVTPDIRLGARSKREGMTIPPDTVAILKNVFFDDDCSGSEVYEDLSGSKHVSILYNIVIGKCLSAPKNGFDKYPSGKRDGFDWIKDNRGNVITSIDVIEEMNYNPGAGADWIDPIIRSEIGKAKKYTLTSSKEVGPSWIH
jgi:poly(beta-D-mannuronate) lyase